MTIRPKDIARGQTLDKQLTRYANSVRPLPGIEQPMAKATLIAQIVDSLRRVEFAYFVRDEQFDFERTDPNEPIFDPLRAAVYWMRHGDADEAAWLVFLFVHFGKHPRDRWRLVRDVYGALGGQTWTWARVSTDPTAFRTWLAEAEVTLKTDGVQRRFGNHRKYESLSATSPGGTARVVETFVSWMSKNGGIQGMIRDAHLTVGQHPHETFDYLYRSMDEVARFGRLARFDFLTMLGKLGIAPIEPGSAYLSGATGPLSGARLLFGGAVAAPLDASQLQTWMSELDADLRVGMQVLEDSLCNWQKSPSRYVRFRG